MISEGAAHKRARNGGETVHAANGAGVDRAFGQRDGVSQDGEGTREDTRRTDTGDGAPDDEGNTIVRDGADKGADLKDENGDEVNPFDGKKGVETAKEELESGGGEEVGW